MSTGEQQGAEGAGAVLHVLGSGSAKAVGNRANASYLIEGREGLSLIDCSGSPAHQILRRGLDLADLSRVFLTHSHTDHVYAMPSLVHSLWMAGLFRDGPLNVHGPAEALTVARSLLAVFGLEERNITLAWNPLGPGQNVLDLPDSPVTGSFPVTHAGLDAVGYRVSATVFSGDAVCDRQLEAAVDDTVRALVVDCGGGTRGNAGHAGARDIAALVRERPSLAEVHLTHIGFPPEEEGSVLAEFGGTGRAVRILEDGDRLVLP